MLKWMCVVLAMLAAVGAMGQQIKPETKAEKAKRMEWWREARLGMFIHWGLYSIPAGSWNGKDNYAEWIREEAHIPVSEYERFRDEFDPVKFDADKWVKMAQDAGMKYVVITTKHHDGFNLFDSPYTDWNISHTPYWKEGKGDIMSQMARACKKYGLKMCWYHSIMDWHHPDYLPRRSWEVADRPADGADFRRFVQYLRDEVSWLLTHYGPIGVMWFDGEWESTWNAKDGDALYALCRKLQPNVIVNNRVTVGRGDMENAQVQAGDFSTPEQFIPPTGLGDMDWETCMTMNDHWGYNSHDIHWKSSKELIHNIVDIASKGGNYLLNIGPRSDGTFPPEAVQRLKDIGDWMRVNSSSIYGTKASVFDSLPWGRSTTKRVGNRTTLYLQVFDWPKDGRLVVPGIGNNPRYASVLNPWMNDKQKMYKVERSGSDLVIHLDKSPANPYCTVVAIDFVGSPIIYRAPKIESPSAILVDRSVATIDSGSKELQLRYTTDGSDPSVDSSLYKAPIVIRRSMTLKAASFHHGKRVSPIASLPFQKVTPMKASMPGAQPGLLCEEYKGSWDNLPDFDKLTPRDSFDVRQISLFLKDGSALSKEEDWGRRFSGCIEAPSDAVYEFALTSDDGSRLWIDGQLIVDNDGLHGAVTKTGHVALAKGWHKIVIGWFNKSGGLDLHVAWSGAGEKLKAVGTAELSH